MPANYVTIVHMKAQRRKFHIQFAILAMERNKLSERVQERRGCYFKGSRRPRSTEEVIAVLIPKTLSGEFAKDDGAPVGTRPVRETHSSACTCKLRRKEAYS